MEEETSILKTVREAVGLPLEDNSFDHELLLHINGALATLNQNGIGLPIVAKGINETWEQFKDEGQVDNYMFEQAKLFVFLKTKILFDPPPPSTVKYMDEATSEMLWRLRESYDISEGGEVTDGL